MSRKETLESKEINGWNTGGDLISQSHMLATT